MFTAYAIKSLSNSLMNHCGNLNFYFAALRFSLQTLSLIQQTQYIIISTNGIFVTFKIYQYLT